MEWSTVSRTCNIVTPVGAGFQTSTWRLHHYPVCLAWSAYSMCMVLFLVCTVHDCMFTRTMMIHVQLLLTSFVLLEAGSWVLVPIYMYFEQNTWLLKVQNWTKKSSGKENLWNSILTFPWTPQEAQAFCPCVYGGAHLLCLEIPPTSKLNDTPV